ncbi:MAG: hypothetical protein AB7T49_10885 [Oligoflexales bacterium]
MRLSSWTIGFIVLSVSTANGAQTIVSEARKYSVGVDYSAGIDMGTITYTTKTSDVDGELPEACEKKGSNLKCTTYLMPSLSSGAMVYLSKRKIPTKFYFFDYGYSVGFKTYEATDKLPTAVTDQAIINNDTEYQLDRATVHLYGPRIKGYVSLGLTPNYFPDFLLHYAWGVQTLFGEIRINDEKYRRALVTILNTYEFELVWFRTGKGSVSSFVGIDAHYGDERNLHIKPVDEFSDFSLNMFGLSVGLIRMIIPLG